MTCKLIVFSPTGGTQRAAELLAEPFQPIAETIDLCAMHTAAVLADFGRKIADKLANHDDSVPTFPGNRPYRPYTPSPMHPQGNAEVCTKCGACVAACPVGAITSDKPYETQEHCISCMRCVKVCPQHTRTLNPAMLAGLTQ